MSTPAHVQKPTVPGVETLQTLTRMIMGFRVTLMIYVAARLGIADLLGDGPKGVDALARATQTHAPSLYRLLRGLASVGLFAEDDQGRFALTPLAEPLRSGIPDSQRARALYWGDPSVWQSWAELLHCVTTGQNAFQHLYGMESYEYRAQNPELNAIFDDLMTAVTNTQTAAVVAAYDFSGTGTLVDVGGGHGGLLAAILKANPGMRGILFDQPHVVAGAKPVLEAAGVADRCEVLGGDFFASAPSGGDAYILKNIIVDWDDERALAILKNCRRVMPEHGRLLLVESVIPPGNDPHPGKLLDLQMLVHARGRARTEAEFPPLLAKAGFKLMKIVPTGAQVAVIEGAPV